ncbi:MAG: hypothetical protein HQM14_13695 [SAR324 cluster bacterium]|nr:hypothetical protein [SAR324 cluster bacterium]
MKALISVCAWCKMVKTPTGWRKEQSAFKTLKISKKYTVELTHGICPSCAVKWAKVDLQKFQVSCQKEARKTAA